MGMRSGKALKVKRTAARKPAAKKSATKQVAAVKPKVVTRTVTVTVDRNDALRALAQRIVDATVANDEAAMLALYAPNVESREAANPPSTGIAALREKFAMWRNMVSDSAFLPRSICADGKTIVIEWDGRVTLAASGRVAEMNEVAIHEIEHGRIVRERFYYDPGILQP